MKRFFIISLIFFMFTSCDQIWKQNANQVSLDNLILNTNPEYDWLVIMYADGDNNLNNDILLDVNEAEYGLSLIQDSDGYPLNGMNSVKVIVLWDGNDKPSYLLDLGQDTEVNYKFSSNTKNFTKNAEEWMSEDGYVEVGKGGEVAMSSYETLANLLTWVNEHYRAKHTILVLEDHGTGPGYLYSRNIVTDDSRAICQDYSEDEYYSLLSSQDVSTGLSLAGYGNGTKLDIIMEDICYGASIEDVYQLHNFTDYYIGSANQVPGSGNDYTKLVYTLATCDSTEGAAKAILKNFADDYTGFNPMVLGSDKNDRKESTSDIVPTFSVYDCSKVPDLAQAVTELANLLLAEGDSRNFNSSTKYNDYLRDNFVKDTANYANLLYYTANMNYMFDLGWMMNRFAYVSSEEGAAALSGTAWPELETASKAVIDALREATVCAWRDSYYSQESKQYGMYSRLDGNLTSDYTNHAFGLTIAGGSTDVYKNSGKKNHVYSWYKTDLAFGADTTWYELLVDWFKTVETR